MLAVGTRGPDRGGAAPACPLRLGCPSRRPLRGGHGRRVVRGRRVDEADGRRAGAQRPAGAAHPLAALRHDRDGSAGHDPLQAAYAVGPLAASQAPLLIVDPLASIVLGIELFHEQLRTGPGYVFGAVVSLAVLGAGVVMLSIWAPPVMKAEDLARLPGPARPVRMWPSRAGPPPNATRAGAAARLRGRPDR